MKSILFRDAARESVRHGIAQVAKAARSTLGPRGRHVIFERPDGSLQLTKDGVTVVEQIELENPFENIGAQLIRQAASITGHRAGDGTTTATLLAEAVFVEGLKEVVTGANPIELEQGIRQAVADVVAQLQEMSMPATDKGRLRQVATIASNGDEEIGTLLSDALSKAGKEGLVMLEDGAATSTEVEWGDGIRFDRGYMSACFVNNVDCHEKVPPRASGMVGGLAQPRGRRPDNPQPR